MRLATFNVENLFDRPKAMNLADWKDGKPILQAFSRLNDLIELKHYTDSAKAEIGKLYFKHKAFIDLRERKERLGTMSTKAFKVTANGRADWIGWFELTPAPVKEPAIENTARVIREIHPDVLCVVETEDRIALKSFNEQVIAEPKAEPQAKPFDHLMLIDGNDPRGIDVAIMVNEPFKIEQIASHVDDKDDQGIIFSRDCAEYTVTTPKGGKLLVMENHFKSKSGTGTEKKRERQAKRVREIYEQRLQEGFEYIAIVGDLNTDPDSAELAPLTHNSLTDVMAHPMFVGDGLPGTFGAGKKDDKLDYILMSPKLAAKVTYGGIERRGVWGGHDGTAFPHFPEIKKPLDAASDHAALFVDVDL